MIIFECGECSNKSSIESDNLLKRDIQICPNCHNHFDKNMIFKAKDLLISNSRSDDKIYILPSTTKIEIKPIF